MLCKASAWYKVTYQGNLYRQNLQEAQEEEEQENQADEWSMSDRPLLSFPWIVSPVLAYIKSQNSNENPQRPDGTDKELANISKLIIGQTKQMFVDQNLQEAILEDFRLRQILRDELPDQISLMSLLGASMTGLNISDKKPQPLQIYVHIGWNTDTMVQINYLTRYDQYLRRSLRIKHFSITTNDHHVCLYYTTVNDQRYSISADPFEMLKSFYIYQHIMQAPLILQLLMVIMHWARKRYMTGSARDSFIAVEDLAVLFIRFCEHSGFIEEVRTLHFSQFPYHKYTSIFLLFRYFYCNFTTK